MPKYTYRCNSCRKTFEIISLIKDYKPVVDCVFCSSTASRKLASDCAKSITLANAPKTLGSLAERNTDRLSEDAKYHLRKKQNAYRTDGPFDIKLPEGAKRLERDENGKPKVSTKQRYSDGYKRRQLNKRNKST